MSENHENILDFEVSRENFKGNFDRKKQFPEVTKHLNTTTKKNCDWSF